jgi:DNA primase
MTINNVPFETNLMSILEELRTQLSANGIQLLHSMRDTPDNIQVCCPYHKGGQERKPSAGIKKSDGTFHCFACGETHTLQEMISHCFGRSDDIVGAFGWEWLLKNFLTVSIEERKSLDLDLSRDAKEKPSSLYISDDELDKYREYHPYMWKRKMTPEVVEIFDIGYDADTQSITFPVRDIDGNCLFVARRSVVTKFFNYPKGVEKPIYGLYELHKFGKSAKEVIICESMIDAIYFWTVGKYAVALNGLGNELQFAQLKNMQCRKFILCTDSDEAGMKARARIRRNIRNKLITEYILPEGRKDANDCTQEELLTLQEKF